MFLISDKLDKSESQYDLMKEQKDDLEKNENIDFALLTPSKIQKCDKSHFLYALLIGVVFFFAIWTMVITSILPHLFFFYSPFLNVLF